MKLPEQCREKRRETYEGLFDAQTLCFTGLIIMPALLFNPNTAYRVFLFGFFWFLAWLSGRKNRPLFTILVVLCIVAFNLIFPYGQILYSIGTFRITTGALEMGIHRAVTFGALLMLSRITIREDLKIPGLFGGLVAESFRLLSVIMNQKYRITRKNLMGDIDNLMIELSNGNETLAPGKTAVSHTKPAGYVILSLVAILSWLLLIFTFRYAV